MNRQKTGVKIFFLLAFILSGSSTTNACSLALHDWKLNFYLKIPITSPIFPLAEISAAVGKIPENSARQISWITGANFFSQLSPIFIPLLPDWTAKIPWQQIDKENTVINVAQNSNKGAVPLVIGSDECVLKIAFFSDANSNYNCHQLVILQANRIRAVFPDKKSPWAQEINGQSWVSLIFYQLPVPGRILSFSTFPIASNRMSIYEDHDYVEKLLAEKKLFRRPDLVIDPFMFDFPELPE